MRRQAIALRLRLSGEELAQRSRAICDRLLTHFPQLAAMRVGFCWPMKNEPDLLPLLTAWHKTGGTSFAALLPVVVAPDAMSPAFQVIRVVPVAQPSEPVPGFVDTVAPSIAWTNVSPDGRQSVTHASYASEFEVVEVPLRAAS